MGFSQRDRFKICAQGHLVRGKLTDLLKTMFYSFFEGMSGFLRSRTHVFAGFQFPLLKWQQLAALRAVSGSCQSCDIAYKYYRVPFKTVSSYCDTSSPCRYFYTRLPLLFNSHRSPSHSLSLSRFHSHSLTFSLSLSLPLPHSLCELKLVSRPLEILKRWLALHWTESRGGKAKSFWLIHTV